MLLVGSARRLPQPFGEAGNGIIVFGAGDGDIYALDVATGVSTPIVADGPADETPEFSHDGSRFVFARMSETPGRWLLLVADASGGCVRPRRRRWIRGGTHGRPTTLRSLSLMPR